MKNKIIGIPVGARSAVVYTIATMFSRGLAIISVPVFTRILTTSEMGVVNTFSSWYTLLSALATLSLTSGGFAVAMKEYEKKRDSYISSVQTLTSIVALGLAVAYFIAPGFWCDVLGLSAPLVILMLIGFLVAPARDFWMSRLRYEYKYKLSGAVSMISALVAVIVSVFVVIQMRERGVENLAEWRLISNYIIIFGVAAVIWVYQFIKGKTFINKEFWSFSLKLSLPLVGYQIAAQILNVSDRLMIDKIIGKSAVGIYGTLYSVSTISLMVWNAINASFVPYLFQNIEKKENKIKQISFGMLEAYAAIAIVLTFLAPEIVKILATEEYYEAVFIMPPISAGIFFTSVAHIYSNISVYYKKTKYVMYGSFIAAIVNVALNAAFIPIFGYMAAAYTTLIGYVVMAFLEAFWAVKLHKKTACTNESLYDDKKILVLSVVVVIITLSGLILYTNDIIRYVVTALCIVVAFFFIRRMMHEKKESDKASKADK